MMSRGLWLTTEFINSIISFTFNKGVSYGISCKNPNQSSSSSSTTQAEVIMPSPRRVSQILKGKKPPKPKTVNAMAKRAVRKKK